jgi:hypothetical protein
MPYRLIFQDYTPRAAVSLPTPSPRKLHLRNLRFSACFSATLFSVGCLIKMPRGENMLKITRVDTLDDEMIDIELSNGSIILLDMKPRQNDPAYARLWSDGLIVRPRTDGSKIFWGDLKDDICISLDSVFEMLAQ